MAVLLHAVPLAGVCRKERSSPVPQVRARPELRLADVASVLEDGNFEPGLPREFVGGGVEPTLDRVRR